MTGCSAINVVNLFSVKFVGRLVAVGVPIDVGGFPPRPVVGSGRRCDCSPAHRRQRIYMPTGMVTGTSIYYLFGNNTGAGRRAGATGPDNRAAPEQPVQITGPTIRVSRFAAPEQMRTWEVCVKKISVGHLIIAVLILGLVWVITPVLSDSSDGELREYAKKEKTMTDNSNESPKNSQNGSLQIAVLAGGCFWCVEAVYERIEGVVSAVSGYTGGTVPDPSYTEVTTGNTGHAEAVKITFDPDVISYEEILKIFWKSHDPTTLNRQGADVGTQYRSAIFYANDDQKKISEASLREARESFKRPIVTEIAPLEEFYEAEDYHQDYFAQNPNAGYCRVVIAPKLGKLFGETY